MDSQHHRGVDLAAPGNDSTVYVVLTRDGYYAEAEGPRDFYERCAAACRLTAWDEFLAIHWISAWRAWRWARSYDQLANEAQS